jgi:hypothetical protein
MIAFPGLFVHDSTVFANLHGLIAVMLVGCHELDLALAAQMVVLVNECAGPLPGLVFPGKCPSRVSRAVLSYVEQRFLLGVAVADVRPREQPEHAQYLQPALQRGLMHGIAVVSVEDQRLATPFADPLLHASPTDQIFSKCWAFTLGYIPMPPPCGPRPPSPDRGRARSRAWWWVSR